MRVTVALLLLVGIGIGEPTDEPAEIKVELKGMAPAGKARLGYSSPRAMNVEHTVPRFLFKVPKFTAKDPLFFRMSLGQTKGVPFFGAIDKSLASDRYDRLYLDRNRDLDLTNDGEPIQGNIRTLWTAQGQLVEFLDVALDLPYRRDGKELKETYHAVVFYVLDRNRKKPNKIIVERDGWREGVVELGGAKYTLAVVDDDSDGQFSTGDSWVLMPAATPTELLLSRDATRTMLFPSWSADQKWTIEVKAVESDGRSATLTVQPAKEMEREYFARIARQRQTAEERKLKIDPLRPKAAKTEKIDWLREKDADYALKEIAQNENVRKPVLLDFTSKACPWCAMMTKYTFRDREVVALAKKFVCSKIKFVANTGDSKRYDVDGTPTYVILAVDGGEIARHAGFMRPTDFAAWLKAALR